MPRYVSKTKSMRWSSDLDEEVFGPETMSVKHFS